MTDFELAQVLIGASQAAVGAIGIYFLVMNLKASRLALEKSTQANELIETQVVQTKHQQRPWIKLSPAVEQCEVRENNLYFLLKVDAKNVGITTASDVVVRACILEGMKQKLDENIREVFASQKTVKGGKTVHTIFPECAEVYYFNLYLPLLDIDDGQKVRQRKRTVPLILIEASYKSGGSDVGHVTTSNFLHGYFSDFESFVTIDIDSFDCSKYESKSGFMDDVIT